MIGLGKSVCCQGRRAWGDAQGAEGSEAIGHLGGNKGRKAFLLCALPGLHSGPFRAPGAPRVTTHQAGESMTAQALGPDGHIALPRWVIEPGIKQKRPPGRKAFLLCALPGLHSGPFRVMVYHTRSRKPDNASSRRQERQRGHPAGHPEHRGSQRIKPGRVCQRRHSVTKFGPPGR